MSRKTIQLSLSILVILGSAWYCYQQLVPAPTSRQLPTDVTKHLPEEIQAALPAQAIALLDGVEMPAAVEEGSEKRIVEGKAQPVLIESFQSGDVVSHFSGNGRDVLHVTASNRGSKAAKLRLKEGTLFESGREAVVLLRPTEVEIPAGETMEMELVTAATSMRNTIGEREFTRSQAWLPGLDPLLAHLQSVPDVSVATAQTAVLALIENAPLDLFAKFQRLHPEIPAGVDKDAFRAETEEILGALMLLRGSGIPESTIAIAAEPQLKLESMIDRDAHDLATEYFGITKENEWGYWKGELLSGALTTRHYALFGIAQNYPDVALTMLPDWVRERRLQKIYRLSAVRALAMTERVEAIAILEKLLQDDSVIGDSEIEKSARHAIRYLEYQAAKAAEATVEQGGPTTAQATQAMGQTSHD